jgi:RimJ/RimL family protein N-acetyltransferase
MHWVDIKSADSDMLLQYVGLRNMYVTELATEKVELEETLCWLKQTPVIIQGMVEDDELRGVGIVYRDRHDELTYFARYPRRGIGTLILKRMEDLASAHGIDRLWAKVNSNNVASARCLIRNGWVRTKSENKRTYFAKSLRSDLRLNSVHSPKARSGQ